jgi:hypothetical protein
MCTTEERKSEYDITTHDTVNSWTEAIVHIISSDFM